MGVTAPDKCDEEQGGGLRRETAAAMKPKLPQGIPQEYRDVAQAFSEDSSDKLPPHPTGPETMLLKSSLGLSYQSLKCIP